MPTVIFRESADLGRIIEIKIEVDEVDDDLAEDIQLAVASEEVETRLMMVARICAQLADDDSGPTEVMSGSGDHS